MTKCLLTLFYTICCFFVQAQITCDGNLVDSYWGMPLATSAGGPAPCSSSNNTRLNSLFATANDTSIFIGIGGIAQSGHQLVLFIDSKSGGWNNASFNRTTAPTCLQGLPAGTTFDAGFTADYCLLISTTNSISSTTLFRLFALDAAAGTLTDVADVSATTSTIATGCRVGISPSATDFTKGYELSLPRAMLGYTPTTQSAVRFMAMVLGDDGNLSNQFLTHADATAATCFGKGTNSTGVQFQNEVFINPVEFNPSRSLPINFLNVRSFQIGQDIKIFWTSASEKDMLEYQVERSSDALQYNQIGKVVAQGNSNVQTSYFFTDARPLIGKSFYRVKAIDRNGRSTYSLVMKMQYGHNDNLLTIYPNPVKDQINLQIIGLKPDTYQLEVFNDLGQRLIRQNIVYTGGYGLQQIPLLPNMRKGPYRLLLRNQGYFYKQNFIVQ